MFLSNLFILLTLCCWNMSNNEFFGIYEDYIDNVIVVYMLDIYVKRAQMFK